MDADTPPPFTDANQHQAPASAGPILRNGISATERNWAMGAHFSGLVGYFIIPFGNVIAPLIIWLIFKDKMPFVDRQGKEALNFQISITIYMLISFVLMLVVVGFITFFAVYILGLVYSILAGIAASDGKEYRYSMTIRFIH